MVDPPSSAMPSLRGVGSQYVLSEFMIDRAAPAEVLAGKYAALAGMAAKCTGELADARTPGWTGQAGSAFNGYLGDVRTTVDKYQPALRTAVKACDAAAQDYAQAYRAAGRAVTALNDTQEKFSAMVGRDSEPSERFPPGYAEAMRPHLDALVRAITEDADTSGRLVRGLRHAADTFATNALPDPPDARTIPDKGEASLLQAAVGEVGAAMAGIGDTAAARATLTALNRFLNAGDAAGVKTLLTDSAAGLSGPELDWVLNHVPDDSLDRTMGFLDPATDRAVYNALAGKLSLDTVYRLAAGDPHSYWHPGSDPAGYTWMSLPAMGTPTESGFIDPMRSDILEFQNLYENVALTTGLRSVLGVDPAFLDKHVVANPNGTYTVTLYKDGQPAEVVVTPDLLLGEPMHSMDRMESPTGYRDGTDPVTRAEMYAKAYAQAQAELNGDRLGQGYDAVNRQTFDPELMSTMSGSVTTHAPHDVGLEGISAAVADHRPVMLSITGEDFDADARIPPGLPRNEPLYVLRVGDVDVAPSWEHPEMKPGVVVANGEDAWELTDEQVKALYGEVHIGGK